MADMQGKEKELSAADRQVEQVLSSNPLFSSLEGFYIKDLIGKGERRVFSAGSQIISEGESGEEVFFIISGKVKVTLYGEEGREIVLSILRQGDMVGEMSIIDDLPRSANVEAIEDLDCLVIGKQAFLNYLSKHHRVYIRFLAYLTGRLREATRKIGGLALLDVCGRIAHTLIGMAGKKGTASGVVAVDRITHEEIAAMIGSSREVVSRALKKMAHEGYIKIEKDKMILYIEQ